MQLNNFSVSIILIMSLEIREVKTLCDKLKFIQFVNDLYKDDAYYCPPLLIDELNTFNKRKNPVHELSEHIIYMAYRDGHPVGRIVGIINHEANRHWNVKKVRFGWFDFIDDLEVSTALLDKVVEWGKSKGMDKLNGPVGFTDYDHQGLLIYGFDQAVPMASLYNYSYYVKHYEHYGLIKEADWIEYKITTPIEVPERMQRLVPFVKQHYNVRVDKVHSVKELRRKYGYQYMDVFNEAYTNLYNFQPMTQKQREYIANLYFPLLNFDFVTIIVNNKDEIIGAGVGMPDITDALRKCKGRLFPSGWYYLIKALKAKKMEAFDLLLIALKPEYQDKGINVLFFDDQVKYFARYGIKRIETSAILETNHKSAANFVLFPHELHKRRRAYVKDI